MEPGQSNLKPMEQSRLEPGRKTESCQMRPGHCQMELERCLKELVQNRLGLEHCLMELGQIQKEPGRWMERWQSWLEQQQMGWR